MAFRSRRKAGARRYVRFTRWRRERFFHVLAETAHAQLAAEAAGVSIDCIYRLRRVEAGFAERMDAARAAADARLRAEAEAEARRLAAIAEDEGWGVELGSSVLLDVASTGSVAARDEREDEGCGAERGSSLVPSPSHAALPRGPLPLPETGEGFLEDWREGVFVVRRGIGGRLRVMAAGTRWWTERHDAMFLAHLRSTGDVAYAARAIGFTRKSAYNPRDRLPSFARAWNRELDEAEQRLERRVVAEALAGTPAMCPGAYEAGEPERLDPWLAIHYLKWREKKRRRR